MVDPEPVVLAKDGVDVGIYTNRYDEMAAFYGGELGLASDQIDGPRPLRDPDGTDILVVPIGHHGVTGIAVMWASRDLPD